MDSSKAPAARKSGALFGEPWVGKHIPALDGFRGMAILLVMFHHFLQPFRGSHHGLDRSIVDLSGTGWSGVDLFFVLSGFLITGILYDAREKPSYFKNFYARRVLRIFPLYFAMLAVYFIIFPLIPHPRFGAYVAESVGDQVWFWTYLTNLQLVLRGDWYVNVIPNLYWSLAVEEHFYFLWPAVVLFFDRRRLLWVCGAIIAGGFGLRVIMTLAGADPIATYVLTPTRIDTIVMGAVVALLARGPGGLRPWRPWAVGTFMVCGAFLVAVFFLDDGLRTTSDLTRTWGFSALAGFYAAALALVLLAHPTRLARRFFSHPVPRMFGKYSYALYIMHAPVASFLLDVVKPFDIPEIAESRLLGMTVYALACTVGSLGAALASWNLLEKHFLNLKRFFTDRYPGTKKGRDKPALSPESAVRVPEPN